MTSLTATAKGENITHKEAIDDTKAAIELVGSADAKLIIWGGLR